MVILTFEVAPDLDLIADRLRYWGITPTPLFFFYSPPTPPPPPPPSAPLNLQIVQAPFLGNFPLKNQILQWTPIKFLILNLIASFKSN